MTIEKRSAQLLGKVDFDATNSFSQAFLDYIAQKPELEPFHGLPPEIASFKSQLENRTFSTSTRSIVSSALTHQYDGLETSEATVANINHLKSADTFTITTGHQLNIFTGPLYFIYKIVTVINACKKLKETYPEYNFVPVYWMASEDHDFDEIDHFTYGGRKFSWDTDQTGAVGRFDPASIKPIFDEISMPEFFKEAYLKHQTLAEAARYYVNALFGDEGIVVIDADDADLKRIFEPVIKEDVFKNTPNVLVNESNTSLEKIGYKAQVFPREINFFYLKENIRARIVKNESQFSVLDHDIHFSESELMAEIEAHPERFSPNVVLRPLYQETILPNLAYVGGPSELVYWFQLKEVFSHFNTDFPILLPRNFAGVLTPNLLKKIEKSSLSFEEIFIAADMLIKDKVKSNTAHDLELTQQLEDIKNLFSKVSVQAEKIDPTLEKLVLAEQRRAEKAIQKIEGKLLKAEKRNQETLVNRIYDIKEALFPNGVPQERKDNFLNFYLTNPKFVELCLESFDPFDLRFHLISNE